MSALEERQSSPAAQTAFGYAHIDFLLFRHLYRVHPNVFSHFLQLRSFRPSCGSNLCGRLLRRPAPKRFPVSENTNKAALCQRGYPIGSSWHKRGKTTDADITSIRFFLQSDNVMIFIFRTFYFIVFHPSNFKSVLRITNKSGNIINKELSEMLFIILRQGRHVSERTSLIALLAPYPQKQAVRGVLLQRFHPVPCGRVFSS